MKKLLSLWAFAALLFASAGAYAQVDSSIEDVDYDELMGLIVEESAEFPGGESAMYKFIEEHLQYPEQALKEGIQGTVWVSFIIEKDGNVTNIKILKDIGGGCGEAAVAMVKQMPRWEPAKHKGKAVRMQFNMPIKFVLPTEE